MLDQWMLLLRNAGEWRGSFDTLDRHLQLTKRQPSILSLEAGPSGVPINLTLLFWPSDPPIGADPYSGEPAKRIAQSFSSPDPDLVFFSTGSFCRGTPQVSTWSRLYAEFGFLHADRRHRLVLLWDAADRFDHLVLIREFRAGTSATENPALTGVQLLGTWQAQDVSLDRDGSQIEAAPSTSLLQLQPEHLAGVTWLPDGGGFRVPQRIDQHQPFKVEALWMATPQRLEWIQRCYGEGGSWLSTSHRLLQR